MNQNPSSYSICKAQRLAIVSATWHSDIVHQARDAAIASLVEQGWRQDQIDLIDVPGALEIPLVLQTMARSGNYDALVALGAVIRGETYHFEVVANQSAAGVQQVALEFGLPVANAILTTEDDAQALARAAQKGAEAARVAVEMANLVGALSVLDGGDDDEDDEDDDEDEDEDDDDRDIGRPGHGRH